MYGPYDNFDPEDSHVIPALIRSCHQAKMTGGPFVVRGSGKPLRQFMFAEDFARVLLKKLEDTSTESEIIAPTEEYSIAEVAQMIENAFDYHVVTFDTSYSDGQFKKTVTGTVDVDSTPLEEGIQKTVAWYVNRLEKRNILN